MSLISVLSTDGLYHLQAALAEARVGIDVELRGAIAEVTIGVANELRDNSPSGIIRRPPGPNPDGDSEGPLAYSFMNEGIQLGEARCLGRVTTSQPTKLKYVRYGTGIYGPSGQRIYPIPPRKALRWVDWGGVHFARSVAGQQPYDFVTPIVTKAREEGRILCTVAVGTALLEAATIR